MLGSVNHTVTVRLVRRRPHMPPVHFLPICPDATRVEESSPVATRSAPHKVPVRKDRCKRPAVYRRHPSLPEAVTYQEHHIDVRRKFHRTVAEVARHPEPTPPLAVSDRPSSVSVPRPRSAVDSAALARRWPTGRCFGWPAVPPGVGTRSNATRDRPLPRTWTGYIRRDRCAPGRQRVRVAANRSPYHQILHPNFSTSHRVRHCAGLLVCSYAKAIPVRRKRNRKRIRTRSRSRIIIRNIRNNTIIISSSRSSSSNIITVIRHPSSCNVHPVPM